MRGASIIHQLIEALDLFLEIVGTFTKCDKIECIVLRVLRVIQFDGGVEFIL